MAAVPGNLQNGPDSAGCVRESGLFVGHVDEVDSVLAGKRQLARFVEVVEVDQNLVDVARGQRNAGQVEEAACYFVSRLYQGKLRTRVEVARPGGEGANEQIRLQQGHGLNRELVADLAHNLEAAHFDLHQSPVATTRIHEVFHEHRTDEPAPPDVDGLHERGVAAPPLEVGRGCRLGFAAERHLRGVVQLEHVDVVVGVVRDDVLLVVFDHVLVAPAVVVEQRAARLRNVVRHQLLDRFQTAAQQHFGRDVLLVLGQTQLLNLRKSVDFVLNDSHHFAE